MQHMILDNSNIRGLNDEVEEALNDGWTVYGHFSHILDGPNSSYGQFYQAVVKLDRGESPELLLAGNRLNHVE